MFIIAPVKTEKAVAKMEFDNMVTFAVADEATKGKVKEEVEKMFRVKVASVRIHNREKGGKRAIVKLAKGSKMDEIAEKLKLV